MTRLFERGLAAALLLLLLLSGGKGAAANRYTELFRERADRAIAAFERGKTGHDRRESPWNGDVSMINLGYLCYVVGLADEEKRYVDVALKMYDCYLDQVDGKRLTADFHAYRPFALMTRRLDTSGLLTGDRRTRARKLAEGFMHWFSPRHSVARVFLEEMWDHNIHMATYVAVRALSLTFPDLPGRTEADSLCNEVVNRIIRKCDLNENASNYSTLGAAYFYDLLRLDNRMELLSTPGFRDYFLRWRDMMSPAIMLPEFGDSYFYHNQLPLDLVLMMEVAAGSFDDASFSDEAQRIMSSYGHPAIISDDQMFRSLLLAELELSSSSHASDRRLSFVSKRRLDSGALTFDKLVLKTGNRPGDAMIAMDLYCRGSHAHEFRESAILYYEAGGVPLFHSLGRRGTSGANFANLFWMTPAGNFPGHPAKHVWNTMTIPVDRLQPKGEKYIFGSRKLDFRTFPQKDLNHIVFDNLRLVGPKNTLLIDGFETAELWDRNLLQHNPAVRIESVEDRTEGDRAQQIQWNLFTNEVVSRLLPESFMEMEIDPQQYDRICLDYKYEGPLPCFHFRGWCARQLDLGCSVLQCRVGRASVEQLGKDAYARIEYDDYMEPGAKLTREIVLTREGILVIRDTFHPTERCIGMDVGQLWQLYTLKERGRDYFVAFDDGRFPQPDGKEREKRCMLVKYLSPTDMECGHKQFVPGYMHAYRLEAERRVNYRSFHTTYSTTRVKDLKPLSMLQVIYPLAESEYRNAARIASETHIEPARGKRSRLRIPTSDGQSVQLSFTQALPTITRQTK